MQTAHSARARPLAPSSAAPVSTVLGPQYPNLDTFLKTAGLLKSFARVSALFDSSGLGQSEAPRTLAGQIELLEKIKVFFHKYKAQRLGILRGTILDGTDCLTLCTLGTLLARERGGHAAVGVPFLSAKVFHALVVVPDEKEPHQFRMAGSSTTTAIRTLGQSELMLRLRLTAPIIRTGNCIRSRIV